MIVSMQDPNPTGRYSFPLSALFVLMAACSVAAALIAPIVRGVVAGDVGVREYLGTSLIGSIAVMLFCGFIGLYHHRPGRGFLWGILTGGIVGMVVAPLSIAPLNAFLPLLTTSLAGAVMLVVIGALVHRSRKPREMKREIDRDRFAD